MLKGRTLPVGGPARARVPSVDRRESRAEPPSDLATPHGAVSIAGAGCLAKRDQVAGVVTDALRADTAATARHDPARCDASPKASARRGLSPPVRPPPGAAEQPPRAAVAAQEAYAGLRRWWVELAGQRVRRWREAHRDPARAEELPSSRRIVRPAAPCSGGSGRVGHVVAQVAMPVAHVSRRMPRRSAAQRSCRPRCRARCPGDVLEPFLLRDVRACISVAARGGGNVVELVVGMERGEVKRHLRAELAVVLDHAAEHDPPGSCCSSESFSPESERRDLRPAPRSRARGT